MKTAFLQTVLGEVEFSQCLDTIVQAGAEGVGLCYRTAEEAARLGDPAYAAEIGALVNRAGAAVCGLHLGVLCETPALIAPGEILRSQELIRRAVDTASHLGGPDVIVPFFARNRIEFPKEFDAAKKALSDVAPMAEDHGVVLAIESTMHLDQLQAFLDWCGSEAVKACVDTGEIRACRYDPTGMIVALGRQQIAQIHLRDVRVAKHVAPDFNVRLGGGDVNFDSIAHALRSLEYDGWLVLETPPGDGGVAFASGCVHWARRLLSPRLPDAPEAAGAET